MSVDESQLDDSDDYYDDGSGDDIGSEIGYNDDTPTILSIHNITTSSIVDVSVSYHKIDTDKRDTRPYINKFEFTKLYGVRTQQILNGSPPLIHVPPNVTDARDIVKLEFSQKVIPIIIRRYISQSKYEDWRVSEFLNLDAFIKEM